MISKYHRKGILATTYINGRTLSHSLQVSEHNCSNGVRIVAEMLRRHETVSLWIILLTRSSTGTEIILQTAILGYVTIREQDSLNIIKCKTCTINFVCYYIRWEFPAPFAGETNSFVMTTIFMQSPTQSRRISSGVGSGVIWKHTNFVFVSFIVLWCRSLSSCNQTTSFVMSQPCFFSYVRTKHFWHHQSQ